MSIRTRLLTSIVSLSLIIAALIGMAIYGTESMVLKIGNLVDDHVVAQQNLKIVSDAYAVSIVDTSHKVRSGRMSWDEGRQSVSEAIAKVNDAWNAFTDGAFEPEEVSLARTVENDMAAAAPVIDSLVGIFERQDATRLVDFIDHTLYQTIDPITGAIGDLIVPRSSRSSERSPTKTSSTHL